jgi:nucleotide-binding universal stress UspA family protein
LPKKILLAYDGSENAKRALGRAIELSKGSDTELSIVIYVNLVGFETIASKKLMALAPKKLMEEFREEVVQDAENLVAEASRLAKKAGVKDVRTFVLRDGDPADAILFAATKHAPDLIIVGRRGISGIERFLLGGVSSRVVNHAKCDVLVVK